MTEIERKLFDMLMAREAPYIHDRGERTQEQIDLFSLMVEVSRQRVPAEVQDEYKDVLRQVIRLQVRQSELGDSMPRPLRIALGREVDAEQEAAK